MLARLADFLVLDRANPNRHLTVLLTTLAAWRASGTRHLMIGAGRPPKPTGESLLLHQRRGLLLGRYRDRHKPGLCA